MREILMVRHGESNPMNGSLTERGEQQIDQSAADLLRIHHLGKDTLLIASDLSRCERSANRIAKLIGADVYTSEILRAGMNYPKMVESMEKLLEYVSTYDGILIPADAQLLLVGHEPLMSEIKLVQSVSESVANGEIVNCPPDWKNDQYSYGDARRILKAEQIDFKIPRPE